MATGVELPENVVFTELSLGGSYVQNAKQIMLLLLTWMCPEFCIITISLGDNYPSRYFKGTTTAKTPLKPRKHSIMSVCIMIEIFQVWLAVYQLLMNEDCQRKYEFNSYSKEQILKVT